MPKKNISKKLKKIFKKFDKNKDDWLNYDEFFDYLTAIDPELIKSDFQMEHFNNILKERGVYNTAEAEGTCKGQGGRVLKRCINIEGLNREIIYNHRNNDGLNIDGTWKKVRDWKPTKSEQQLKKEQADYDEAQRVEEKGRVKALREAIRKKHEDAEQRYQDSKSEETKQNEREFAFLEKFLSGKIRQEGASDIQTQEKAEKATTETDETGKAQASKELKPGEKTKLSTNNKIIGLIIATILILGLIIGFSKRGGKTKRKSKRLR